MKTKDCVILATDGLTLERCLSLASLLGGLVYGIKIHDVFDTYGPEAVECLHLRGIRRVWADLKLHDIPKTVERRARAVNHAGADILTVHASGGVEMMRAAVEYGPPEIFAVTVLTSLKEECGYIYRSIPVQAVERLVALALVAGVHGVVCSAEEVGRVSLIQGAQSLKIVVPGIRSAGKDAGDQKRVGTPAQVLRDGASYLVIGRQITEAEEPAVALAEIQREIEEV